MLDLGFFPKLVFNRKPTRTKSKDSYRSFILKWYLLRAQLNPSLRSQRQKSISLGLCHEFQGSQGYLLRPVSKIQIK